MKFLHSAASLLDGCHLNERKAFGTLGVFVADDLGISNLTDTVKQIKKVALRSVKRQVSDIQLGRGNLYKFRLPADFLFGRRARDWFFSTFRSLWGGTLEKRDNSLPKRGFRFGSR
jgi:hypothetical protein